MRRISYGIAAAALVTSMAAMPVFGEVAQDEYKGESLVVTAQKQEENVRDVPVSMEVFTGDKLEEAEIGDTSEMVRFVPNLHMRDSGSEHSLIIRGVSSYSGSLVSPAGYYVDDIAYPLQVMHNTDFFDVERVEVLRGPQGTLYGKNSESGLVHVVTRTPGNEVRGRVRLGYGNYNSWDAGASVSGPIVKDKLFASVQFLSVNSDGFVENKATNNDESGKKDHLSGRARFRWTPNDDWEVEYLANALKHEDGYGIFRFTESIGVMDYRPYFYGELPATDYHEILQDTNNQSKDEDASTHSLRLKHSGDAFDMTLVTGFQEYKLDVFGDRMLTLTDNGTNLFSYGSRQTSTELRLSSPVSADRLKWLVGVATSSEETEYDADVDGEGGKRISTRRADIDLVSQAIFGQATWRFAERLYLTGGGRFDFQTVDGWMHEKSLGNAVTGPIDDSVREDISSREFLPKVALRYAATPDVSIYTSAAKGFMAGGFNAWASLADPGSKEYDPEYTMNYEVGMKGRFFNRKLDVETALFYIDIEDKQVAEMDTMLEQSIIRNAASATSWGGELSLTAHVAYGLDLFGGVGIIESEIDEGKIEETYGDGSSKIVDYSGNKLQNVPEYTANAGIQYRHESGLMARLDVQGVGEFYGDPKNITKQDAYQLVNAKIGYEAESWDISLWGKNLTDEEYASYIAPFPNSMGGLIGKVAKDGDPLTFGVTANWRF